MSNAGLGKYDGTISNEEKGAGKGSSKKAGGTRWALSLMFNRPLFRPSQNTPNPSLESRQIPFHCHPDLREIDSKVVMNQDMAHLDDLGPWDIVMRFSKRRGELAGGLTDNLNVVNHPGMNEFVFLEDATASLRIPLDPFDRVEDVMEPLTVIPHRVMASLSTCRRTDRRSPRSEATSTGRLSKRSRSKMSAA